MKSIQATLKLLILLYVSVFINSCKSDKTKDTTSREAVVSENIIEIITEDMEFQMQDTIPSGWNTFLYKNLSPQTHFFIIEKYPEGKSLADAKAEVVPVFSMGMQLINEGKNEEAMAEFGKLPEWYSEVQFLGGTGLISAETTGQTTLKLEPGTYLMECYVKMSNGVFHTSMGMISDFVVSPKNSGDQPPRADINIDLSSENGIVINDTISAGKQTFSVFFADQIVHENFVGHDVNLVKMDKGSELEVLEKWMNWTDPKGFIEPAPNGFSFLGGVNDMPEGHTGYFTAILAPGSYALVSEVPNTTSKNMLKPFIVKATGK